ncbi:MAG: 3-deoxy-7-phosphoheptulonate synthase [Holophagales bacterium]|nr:3-deoxy-7-phosphoheptulonate synthase [Holophagales bacterium]
MSDLPKVRAALDRIDAAMLDLLAERSAVVDEVAALKSRESDLSLRDLERERDLLSRVGREAQKRGLNAFHVVKIFRDVIEASVRRQESRLTREANEGAEPDVLRVAFQGAEGAYSHLAGRKFFGDRPEEPIFVGYRSFRQAVDAVERDECDYAILPLENSVAGSINETYTLLGTSKLHIMGEEVWPVEHCLLGISKVPLARLKRIYSHPQALMQCSEFLESLPGATAESFFDTAASVGRVKELGSEENAAIASAEAGELHGLVVLRRDIANQRNNQTRFVVVHKRRFRFDVRIPCRTSLLLVTDHKEGALERCLSELARASVNMTKLESRSMQNTPWEYQFYVDIEGNVEEPRVATALEGIGRNARYLRVLGCYPRKADPSLQVPRDVDLSPAEEAAAPGPAAPPLASESKVAYPLAARRAGDEAGRTLVKVGDVVFGEGFVVVAGPCAVENEGQVFEAARVVREGGGRVLRGGVFKPRTSPYAFQGLGMAGLDILVRAGQEYGLPIVTEVMSPEDVEKVALGADMLQIGARNMQNFALLKEVGQSKRPVLLKRGMMSSVEELLLAAEYILSAGNRHVVLCERGIRTFETSTRNTLDLGAVQVLKARSHLPVIVDPSHAMGITAFVAPMARAALAAGADGVIVEVHPNPAEALCDGAQALTPDLFVAMMGDLRRVAQALGVKMW